jgi:hypothetical protein
MRPPAIARTHAFHRPSITAVGPLYIFLPKETIPMKTKPILILQATLMMLGALTFQSCFYSRPAYGPPPETVVLGEYDEGHVWHDRYWWISNRHDWVHEHHPEWIEHETPEEHTAYQHHH